MAEVTVAAIAIGRNEGDRLVRCLASLEGQAAPVIYVDSGSTDGSIEAARAAGAQVVQLDMSKPFTAARARNAGLVRLSKTAPDCEFVQFLDGDCTLLPTWLAAALAALRSSDDLAVVCGRRREIAPESSIFNRMIDDEWDTPIGESKACGGDALMRLEALNQVGGYRESLIAGEEPEMCFRMREKGWRILRIDAEMTRHDAAIHKFGQWWQRARRAGHAYAEGCAIHGHSSERYYVVETLRALFWGLGVPFSAVVGSIFLTPWALLIFLAWPLQVLRLTSKGYPLSKAFLLTVGKIAEVQGIAGYYWNRITGKRRQLIEYK